MREGEGPTVVEVCDIRIPRGDMCHLVSNDALVESVEGAGDDELASLSRGPGVLHFGDVAEFDVWYLGAKRSPPWLSYVVGEEALGVFETYAGCEVGNAGSGLGGVVELILLPWSTHVCSCVGDGF